MNKLLKWLAALSMVVALQGCPGLTTVEPIADPTPASQVEAMTPDERAVHEAKQAINEINGAIAGFNVTITQNVIDDVWSPDKAEKLLAESDALRLQLVEARDLVMLGDLSGAEATRKLVARGLLELQRKAGQSGE